MAVTPILVQRQARRLSELLGSDLLLCLRVVALYTKKNSARVGGAFSDRFGAISPRDVAWTCLEIGGK